MEKGFIEEGKKYLIGNYARYPVSFVKGEGVFLYDSEGKRYIDMLAGIAVNTLGYNHPSLTETICKQAKEILHVSNLFYIQPQIDVAKMLVENTCGDKVFFCNSGAEANEAAIKLARRYFYDKGENRFEIITFEGGFHGRTLATVKATAQPKYQEGFEPLPEGFKYAKLNDIDSVKKQITDKTAGVMIEIIQGEGGVRPAEKIFLEELYKLCKEKGILFIVDEVQTGIGRTGKLFAYQHFNIEPDIITSAKGLGGGVPIGAVIAKEKIAKSFVPGTHGSTFGGNYLATAAAKVVLKEILKEGFLKDVIEKGNYLKENLEKLGLKPRGMGLMLGCPLPEDKKASDIALKALQKGLIIGTAGENTLRFVPPLIIKKSDIDEALEILKSVLD
ncbi:MAG: aspartate aminotransferase family protein [Aquificota bacterium]|nr:MAG: aspartate aminotransferase family protein [Aquificota bacterium]